MNEWGDPSKLVVEVPILLNRCFSAMNFCIRGPRFYVGHKPDSVWSDCGKVRGPIHIGRVLIQCRTKCWRGYACWKLLHSTHVALMRSRETAHFSRGWLHKSGYAPAADSSQCLELFAQINGWVVNWFECRLTVSNWASYTSRCEIT